MSIKRKQIVEKLEISDVAAEGKAIGKVDGQVIFVSRGAVPGDVVDVRIVKKKKSYLEALPVHYHSYSEDRQEAFCEYFGECGGCKWQVLPYDKQLHYKQKQVWDNFERIAKVDFPKDTRIMPSPDEKYYRNKLEFTFSALRWFRDVEDKDRDKEARGLGFHLPGMFDRVVDVHECWLQPAPSNEIRNEVRRFSLQYEYGYYDIRRHAGFMRNLIIRMGHFTDQLMVIVVFGQKDMPKIEALMEHLKVSFPQITSLNYIINEKPNDDIADQTVINYSGQEYITEKLDDMMFKIGPKSFFQTNSQQALNLYRKTRELVGLTGAETVYDLYTGTGTIANYLAPHAKLVVGIEYLADAIADAKENARLNGIENTRFFAGDMKDVLTSGFIARHGVPDVLVTDPPRAGMHPDVVETILKAAPRRIVYVSCNPATQARDVALLAEQYQVDAMQALDMFPHTHHVENIALLNRR